MNSKKISYLILIFLLCMSFSYGVMSSFVGTPSIPPGDPSYVPYTGATSNVNLGIYSLLTPTLTNNEVTITATTDDVNLIAEESIRLSSGNGNIYMGGAGVTINSWLDLNGGMGVADGVDTYFGSGYDVKREYEATDDALVYSGGEIRYENELTHIDNLEVGTIAYPFEANSQRGSFQTDYTGTLVGIRTGTNMAINVVNGVVDMTRTQGGQADINRGDIIEVLSCSNTDLNGYYLVDNVSNDDGGYDYLNLTASNYLDLAGQTISDSSTCTSRVWRIMFGQASGIWQMAYYYSDPRLINYNMNEYHWANTINGVEPFSAYRYKGGVHYSYGYQDTWGWSAHELQCVPFNKINSNSVETWCGVANTVDNEISNNRVGIEALSINYETRVTGRVVYVGNPHDYYQVEVQTS